MSATRWIGRHGLSVGVVLVLAAAAASVPAGQGVVSPHEQAEDEAAFKVFSARVMEYLKLRQKVEASLPALKPTDLPELIEAHQQTLAKKLQEARPRAKAGDLFTASVREAFRHASRAALRGPDAAKLRAYMQVGAPDPRMVLAVNGIYPATEPITALPPVLLAAFPTLPDGVAYRVVGRTLILVDVKSHLIIDVARLILPPAK